MRETVTVVGAGLAGCEAAYQLAQRGFNVILCDMKPEKKTPAHKSDCFAELVCSNSLRSDGLQNAVGLLKAEMRKLGSLIMQVADATRVPAGGALAVDREAFAGFITSAISSHPNIKFVTQEYTRLPEPPAIVATGPLTSEGLVSAIEELLGRGLHFFDAAAPIVAADSLDMSKVFKGSRYNKGDDDYLNCPMSKAEYMRFYTELINAETAELKEFETVNVFEGCMPIEAMAKRGEKTLLFGPLKPVGLYNPNSQEKPYAVVQLRQETLDAAAYNLVGFQTNLKFSEQRRVFGLIPGLENAEYLRYGVMHRNTYIESPGRLGWDYQLKQKPGLYFAGQITGVEGYVESAASGLAVGINLARQLNGLEPVDFTRQTAIGALGHYIAEYLGHDFQPMNVNFGIMEGLENPPKNKKERYERIAKRALDVLDDILANKM